MAVGKMNEQLSQSLASILTTQTRLQELLEGGPAYTSTNDGTSSTMPEESAVSNGSSMALFTLQVVNAIKHHMNHSGNNTQMVEITTELKTLNAMMKRYLPLLVCSPPFVQVGSDCISVILVDASWEANRQKCLSMGADLAQPDDLTLLRHYVGTRYPRKNHRNFWIGGVNREKVWQWLSGDLINPNDWHTNEPSGNGQCVGLFDGWEHPLTDFPCENERRAICERPMSKL
ncbi:C-type lectin domain family 1 member B-like [Homarus americanus]|uniref:C-type lectin domain family 1 member B-like n=1 Tax=Homarus americanus TaxID=6706 RepID=A0A8J5N1B6_HOMAM|nr:C-type lectin domain family 1 member B-like [Homarus americanus]